MPESVRAKEGVKGFAVQPKRWISERTFAWLTAHRRRVRAYETRELNSEAMILLAATQPMVKRLAKRLYQAVSYNFEGSERAHQVYNVQTPGGFRDSNTWLAGFQLGELKRKGDWYVSADYRQYGLASIDPNLNDPNFALSRLNTQGFRINVGYNLTDWLKAEVWYYGAWNLDKNVHLLSTGAASTNSVLYDANAAQNLFIQITSSF